MQGFHCCLDHVFFSAFFDSAKLGPSDCQGQGNVRLFAPESMCHCVTDTDADAAVELWKGRDVRVARAECPNLVATAGRATLSHVKQHCTELDVGWMTAFRFNESFQVKLLRTLFVFVISSLTIVICSRERQNRHVYNIPMCPVVYNNQF